MPLLIDPGHQLEVVNHLMEIVGPAQRTLLQVTSKPASHATVAYTATDAGLPAGLEVETRFVRTRIQDLAGRPDLIVIIGRDPADSALNPVTIAAQGDPNDPATIEAQLLQALGNKCDPNVNCPDHAFTQAMHDNKNNVTGYSVIYDATDYNGTGYFVKYRTDDFVLRLRSDSALFHELAHVYHHLVGNAPADYALNQQQAIDDENIYRKSKGMPQRRPDSAGGYLIGCGAGCGPESPPPPPPVKVPPQVIQSRPKQCFIVLLAAGLPAAAEVRSLQRIRDTALRRSTLGDRFLSGLMDDYHRFSAGLVMQLEASRELRGAYRTLALEPLLGFMRLFHRAALNGWEADAVAAGTALELTGRLERLGDQGWTAADILSVNAALLEPHETGPGAGPASAVRHLYEHGLTGGALTSRVRWAVLEPLTAYWAALARLAEGRATADRAARALLVDVERWLVSVPLGPELDSLAPGSLLEDLRLLRSQLFTTADLRYRFARRLSERCPCGAELDLADVLQRSGYLGASAPA